MVYMGMQRSDGKNKIPGIPERHLIFIAFPYRGTAQLPV